LDKVSASWFHRGVAAIPQFDWIDIENKFVAGEMSMRALAMQHGIKPGTLAKHANRPDVTGKTWHEKRAERQTRGKDDTIKALAQEDVKRAVREAKVRDAALDMIYDAIEKQRAQWRETHFVQEIDRDGTEIVVERPKHMVRADELRELLDRIVALAGRPMVMTASAEGDGLGVSISGGVSEDDAKSVLLGLASTIRAGRRATVVSHRGPEEPDPDGG